MSHTGGADAALAQPIHRHRHQNPIEIMKAPPLPEAQLDRFHSGSSVGIRPRRRKTILRRRAERRLDEVSPVVDAPTSSPCGAVEGVRVEPLVRRYISANLAGADPARVR